MGIPMNSRPEGDPPRDERSAPTVRMGPAGWSYADWEGIVYPAVRRPDFRPLELLLSLFPTIEVNATFYRDVPPRQVATWCRQAETRPDFRWCFKLHRRLSHAGGVPTWQQLSGALAAFAPAREAGRLGALLLQFPWSLRRDGDAPARLADLLAAARESGWPLVVEVRHAGWGADASFPPVVCDQPALRGNLGPDAALDAALAQQVTGAGPLYLRLHGRNGAAWFDPTAGRDRRYDYLYGEEELDGWAQRLRAAATRLPAAAPVYVITNNHFRGQAVVNALQLQRLWSGLTPSVPDSLKRTFPRELAAFPSAPPLAPEGAQDRPPARVRRVRRGPGPDDEPSLF